MDMLPLATMPLAFFVNILGGGLFCGFGLFGLISLLFWIWCIIDVVNNEPAEGNDKIIWLLIVIFLQALGGLIYILARRPERIRRYGR
jgi:hypothetical protein